MKSHVLTVLAALSFSGNLSAILSTGAPAPDFSLRDVAGVTHRLSDYRGKWVVLEWTNHLCPFVRKHYQKGHMQQLQKEMVKEGAIWLQVISSAKGKQGYVTAEEGAALRKELDLQATAMLRDPNGKTGRAYDARTTPHVFLIHPEGDLVYQGAIDSIPSVDSSDIPIAENYLKAAYLNAKAGRIVEKKSTKPYGCSVKY